MPLINIQFMIYKNFVGVKKNFPYVLTHVTYNLQNFYILFLAAHTHVKEHQYFLGEYFEHCYEIFCSLVIMADYLPNKIVNMIRIF